MFNRIHSFQVDKYLHDHIQKMQADGVNLSALLRRLLREHIEQTAKKEVNQ
jgi:hypothetical protein